MISYTVEELEEFTPDKIRDILSHVVYMEPCNWEALDNIFKACDKEEIVNDYQYYANNFKTDICAKSYEILLKHGYPLNEDILKYALDTCSLEYIKVFLNYGIDPNTPIERYNMLNRVIIGYPVDEDPKRFEAILKELLKFGADINYSSPKHKYNALHNAIAANKGNIIPVLLKYGADKNAKNSKGYTPWDLAPRAIKESVPLLKPV